MIKLVGTWHLPPHATPDEIDVVEVEEEFKPGG
jgi:hypothetical protein